MSCAAPSTASSTSFLTAVGDFWISPVAARRIVSTSLRHLVTSTSVAFLGSLRPSCNSISSQRNMSFVSFWSKLSLKVSVVVSSIDIVIVFQFILPLEPVYDNLVPPRLDVHPLREYCNQLTTVFVPVSWSIVLHSRSMPSYLRILSVDGKVDDGKCCINSVIKMHTHRTLFFLSLQIKYLITQSGQSAREILFVFSESIYNNCNNYGS